MNLYKSRRNKVLTLSENTLFIAFAGNEILKSADENYPFFANRNFYYITGIRQEDSMLMFSNEIELLYSLPKDEYKEIRAGKRLDFKEITYVSGVTNVKCISSFESDLNKILSSNRYSKIAVCTDNVSLEEPNLLFNKIIKLIQTNFKDVDYVNLSNEIFEHRVIKDDVEINNMRAGMQITKSAINRMMRACKPGMREFELQAEFLHEITSHGELEPSFTSIIASGARNFYLHYHTPFGVIEDGDLVLTDVGAKFNQYCTDVSRVFPANGKFTTKQKEIYSIALNANKTIIKEIKQGQPFSMINEICKEVIYKGLYDIKLIDSISEIDKYVWHRASHYIGLDTHDVGSYKTNIKEGMVFSVDAGIYVREWGIGLRIEDDVLVTQNGCLNLSCDIPKEIEQIEMLMNEEKNA